MLNPYLSRRGRKCLFSRTIGCTVWLAGLLVSGAAVRAADLAPVLVGPSAPVAAGQPLTVWLNWLNTMAEPVVQRVPSGVECRLVKGANRFEGRLELSVASGAGEVTIPAGGFVRREYVLNAPRSLAGAVWLDLPGAIANRILVEIAPATGLAVQPAGSKETLAATGRVEEPPKDVFDPQGLFKRHIFGHEPFYFTVGPKSPNAKIQFSFKYRFLSRDDSADNLAGRYTWLEGFHFGYTQTALWDWNKPSAPFFDTSYKPELLYSTDGVAPSYLPGWFHVDLAGALQHESNGKDGTNSRSINIAYLRPKFTFDLGDDWRLSLSPKAFVYLPDVDDNPDIAKYRGYVELRATIGQIEGAQLSSILRAGSGRRFGSVELDFTYPLWQPWHAGPKIYFLAQYFTGYGESILQYNKSSSSFRAGFSLYR